MPILNYTTTVPASRTVSQMQEVLAKAGAATIAARYDEGKAIGLSFTLMTVYGWRDFTLPVDTDAVYRVMARDRSGVPPRLKTREQAERVAWRIAKDWLEAQLAIVESQMVSFDQVMLPYMHVDGTKTLYQAYEERESALALTTGPES
jgi:hypothetical protein